MSAQWSGDMLDSPEMMEVFATQLRRVLSDQADFVAKIRRDAEAMWRANPPEGYGSFEAWWRRRWVEGPFGQIEDHVQRAAKLTFQLEARFRRGRHEIPERRLAAMEAKRTPALSGPAPQPRTAARQPRSTSDADEDFMTMVRRGGRTA